MAFQGCLLKKNVDQTAASYSGNVNVTWDTEVYDTDAAHTGSSHLITVPSAWNGKYGVFSINLSNSSVASTATGYAILSKNAATYSLGWGSRIAIQEGNGQSSTANWFSTVSLPQLLTTGDTYHVLASFGDASCTVESESTFGVYVHENPTIMMQCLTRKAANQTGANHQTPAVVAWTQDIYDTHAIHDVSTNNTKLIIPSALNGKFAVFQAQIVASALAGNSAESIAITKGGSLTWTGFAGQSGRAAINLISSGVGESRMQCATPAVQLATGEEYEVLYYYANDSSIDIEATRSSFGLRVVG